MKALALIEREVRHRVVDTNHGHQLHHLVRDQVKERCSPLTPDLLQRYDAYLHGAIGIEQRETVAVEQLVFTHVRVRALSLYGCLRRG